MDVVTRHSEIGEELLMTIVKVRNDNHRKSQFFVNNWFAIHVEFGLLAAEPTREAVEAKVKTLYRKRVRNACVLISSSDVMYVYENEMKRMMTPKEKIVTSAVNGVSGSLDLVKTEETLERAFASPHVQPPFRPVRMPMSPRDMVIDGAGAYRNMMKTRVGGSK